MSSALEKTRLVSLRSSNVGCVEDIESYWMALKSSNPATYWIKTARRILFYLEADVEQMNQDIIRATGQSVLDRIAMRLSLPLEDVIIVWEAIELGTL